MEEGISIKKQTNRIEGTVLEGKEIELKIGNLKEERNIRRHEEEYEERN
jgi:hypothetical protein